MYRAKIREYYDHLSRSYAKVADFIMSNYYEVSFMTAAQLAQAVSVDTTTVVRFSQRLGFNGYPDLLADIRRQVREEIYAAYEPQPLTPDDPAAAFTTRIEQESANLQHMLVHNPPEHVARLAEMLGRADRVLLIAEGYAGSVAELTAEQLRHRGLPALAVEQDVVKRTATLLSADEQTLVVGISATAYGQDVARALELVRQRGCATLGLVGSLVSPVNRVSDMVIYAPTDAPGPLPSIVALTAAAAILVDLLSRDDDASAASYLDEYDAAFRFLRMQTPPVEA